MALDDPEWVRRRRVRFVGVDRPGYGYSDPWPEANLLECAGDFLRVADDLGIQRFWALGVSGGAPYVIALGALATERVERIAVVCGADIGLEEGETPEGWPRSSARRLGCYAKTPMSGTRDSWPRFRR